MKIVTSSSLFRLPLLRRYSAIVLGRYCFIKGHEASDRLLGHELVHEEQIQRVGLIAFYMIYMRDYLRHLYRYRDHDKAYAEIAFEKEAYARELEPAIQARVREIKSNLQKSSPLDPDSDRDGLA